MNAAGYMLALAFVESLPLPHRAAWSSLLRQLEPHPAMVREAAQILHLSGHLRHGRLTAEGVGAALEVMHEALTPPHEGGNL